MTDQSDDGLLKLWPTSLMKRQLPGCDQPNELLQQLIETMDADTDNLTTRYRDADFLHMSHPAARWLLQCISNQQFKNTG